MSESSSIVLASSKPAVLPILLVSAAVVVVVTGIILVVIYTIKSSSSSSLSSGSFSEPFPIYDFVTIQADDGQFLTSCSSGSNCVNNSGSTPVDCVYNGVGATTFYGNATGSANQIWQLIPGPNNSFYVLNQSTGLYLNLCIGCTASPPCPSSPNNVYLCCSTPQADLTTTNEFYFTRTGSTTFTISSGYESGSNRFYLSRCDNCCGTSVSLTDLPFFGIPPPAPIPESFVFTVTAL